MLSRQINAKSAMHICQAVWDASFAATAMKTAGLYEAAGLALWMNPGIFGMQKSSASLENVNPGDISLSQLAQFADNLFGLDVAWKASVTRSAGSQKRTKVRERLVWPMEMICLAIGDNVEGAYDSCLPLAGGHFILWSWYYALYSAINKKDPPLLLFNLRSSL